VLFDRMLDGLAGIPAVAVLPATDPRCPTVSFRVDGEAPADTARKLGDRGVCVYSGDYYAYEYFTRVGLRDSGGAVRAGIYHYTEESDVDRLLEGLSAG
jgi:selenocysteine lyase/cysteine desulfurase